MPNSHLRATAGAALPSTSVAQGYYGDGYHARGYDRYDDVRSYDRGYDRDGPRARRYAYRDDRAYRRCDAGTGGTVIGAIAGGLLGIGEGEREELRKGGIV